MSFLKSYFAPGKDGETSTTNINKSDGKKSGRKIFGGKKGSKNSDSEKNGTGQATPAQHDSTAVTPWGQSPWESRAGSRPASMYPMDEVSEIKCNVMCNHIYQQALERLWTFGGWDEGVVLKRGRGQYVACPAELTQTDNGFYHAISQLNVRAALTVSTNVIKIFLRNNVEPFVPIQDGLRLQVLPDMTYLPRCQKHHFAAFIADRGILVVWDDEPRKLLDRAELLQNHLMKMIWRDGQGDDEEDENHDEKVGVAAQVEEVEGSDEEEGHARDSAPRRIMMWHAICVAMTLMLVILSMAAGWRKLVVESMYDHTYIRMGLILVFPATVWLSFFFFHALIGNICQIIGPIGHMNQNTKFFSGLRPKRLNAQTTILPHITIQMPVYKEGLLSVIEPTIRSIKAAISTYEMQGGTANIFVNDDGLQLISEEDARARMDFYDEHNIGWVSRPKHNPKPAEGETTFLRRGKFKKASNMNYALWVSTRVEEKLLAIERHESWTNNEEAEAYKSALTEVVAEDDGRTWADGNVRVGDYILLIDSDTRVPTDCLLDAVSEMEQSPQVAILQYASGVMNVTDNYFEKGITFFTNMVYTQIRYAVAMGDVAPFVGHNAVLRWAALQQIAYDCPLDGREKWWSEATVSEDFDMALRLQADGYLIRLGAYQGGGFKEGVSLTVYDELSRWEKYAYGCNELIFHPLRYWITRGPFTPLFRRFIRSGMPLGSKFTVMAYVGTYYAIGCAWIMTLANYFLMGWFNGFLDHYYLDSFKVYLAIVVVFTFLGNLALAVLRYRIEERSLLGALGENLKWIPCLALFLGGISLHVSQALLSHMFSIDMTWGATAKEVENTTFFQEIPKVLKAFKVTFIGSILLAAAMVVFAHFVPVMWRIDLFVAIYPLSVVIASHFLLPIVLNPNLMLFMW